MWEMDVVPAFEDRAQEVINAQLVRDSDILIGTFWSRFGTPTGVANSGTEGKIQQFINARKRVLLYFSTTPIKPRRLDADQFKKVEAFRREFAQKGIYAEYSSTEQLRSKLTNDLTRFIQKLAQEQQKMTQPLFITRANETLVTKAGQAAALLAKVQFISYVDTLENEWLAIKRRADANTKVLEDDIAAEGYEIIEQAETAFHDFARQMHGHIDPAINQAVDNLANTAWQIIHARNYHRTSYKSNDEIAMEFWRVGETFVDQVRGVKSVVLQIP